MLISKLGTSNVVWLSAYNKYILAQPPAEKIFEWFELGLSEAKMLNKSKIELELSDDLAKNLIKEISAALSAFKKEKEDKKVVIKTSEKIKYHHQRFYKILDKTFLFEYQNKKLEFLIHPKFGHLEVNNLKKATAHFQLYTDIDGLNLVVNDRFIGRWPNHEDHYLAGKVFMQLIQTIHNKQENNWMATFHAAGISNGKDGLLVLGDSGSGKSTLSAILMASGYQILADDFLPFNASSKKMCYFPSALSIKRGAYNTVSSFFPEINKASEYDYPSMGKIVKYLSNRSYQTRPPKDVPCKALVFVKYNKNTCIDFRPLEKDIAFQKLVPDSWISPTPENAAIFLNWFQQLPCYQLTYSDNHQMLQTIKSIFNEQQH